MTQAQLPLTGGHHVGPLFEIRKRRPLVRPPGKQGIVHRAQTVRATPPWADMAAIRTIYAEARRITAETGELHVVDHIVPKCGKTVCGLHVHWNLQILHWLPNARKGAFLWPDMWAVQLELVL